MSCHIVSGVCKRDKWDIYICCSISRHWKVLHSMLRLVQISSTDFPVEMPMKNIYLSENRICLTYTSILHNTSA